MKHFYLIKSGIFLALLLSLARPISAQLPYIVKDIAIGGSSTPTNLTNVNGILFFTATNPGEAYGEELWRSDGTPAGTYMIKDINPGSGSSYISELKNINGTLFFQANDGTGARLWKSNGTLGGTVMVTDGPESPSNITNVNGTIFFRATGVYNDNELWKSDGTSAGTTLVKTIVIGTENPSIDNFTDVNGTLYFISMLDGNSDLWKSDGTSGGTVMVKNFRDLSPLSDLSNLTNLNGTLYFTVDDGEHGLELWKSNGTSQGTEMVKDINLGTNGSAITQIVNANGTLFFMADDGVHGEELWKSDGTAAGTELVKDILEGDFGAYPHFLTNVNGTVFFLADDLVSGRELWKTDGTAAGTVLVKDISEGAWESFITNLLAVDNTLYFLADVGMEGNELWKSDGTEEGTVLVKDINPEFASSEVNNMTDVNGKLYFVATAIVDNINYGAELWSLGNCITTNPIVNTLGKSIGYNKQKQGSSTSICHCDVFNKLISTTDTSGTDPALGDLDTKVWIDNQADTYVRRHYEIYPTTDLPSTTGKITLYFTQADFDAFNTATSTGTPKLPVNSTDNVGISNIIVERYETTSDDNTGLPGSYFGTPSTINFEDIDVNWDNTASRWEISFVTPGFGGFFLKTPILDPPTEVEASTPFICSGDSLLLWAVCPSGTLNWYTTATGGSSLGSSFSLTVAPTSTSTYYAACEYGENKSSRVATNEIVVTLMPTSPSNVQVSSANICSGSSVTLTATCAIGTLTWYDSATGYDIGTGNNLTQTPTTNVTYYAACENGSCASQRVATSATSITQQPTSPTSVFVNQTAICSGTSVSLTANCSTGTITWYNQATGGSAIGTGTELSQTPTSNTTYYASCVNGICTSSRVATSTVVITQQPINPTSVSTSTTLVCVGTNITLYATCNVGTVTWYNQAVDGLVIGTGTALSQTPAYVSNTYYVACENGSCKSERVATSEITLTQQPKSPTDLYQGGADICVGYGVYLTASCETGTPTWYNTSTGGTALSAGNYYSPFPTVTTTYYVACDNGACKSARVAYNPIVVSQQPVNPTGVSISKLAICAGDSITLSGSCLIGTLRWFKTSMDSDTAFTYKPRVNTKYYALCTNGFCYSETILAGEVVVSAKPSNPTNVAASSSTICTGETITLTATCPIGTVSWYNSSTNSTVLGTGNGFNHSPSANTTYYAACVNGICTSERIATNAITIKAKPATPTILSNKTVICSGESVTLTASTPSNTPAATFRWTGGLSSSTASLTLTPSLTTNYKVAATFNGCNSDSSAIVRVTVNQTPQQPSITANKATICKGDTAILTAQCPSTSDRFYWSNAALPNADANVSYTNTRKITEPGTYKGWCESTLGCRGPERSVTITAGSNCNGKNFIIITPAKPILCPGSSVTLTATGCTGTLTWSGGASSQTDTAITVNPTATTTYIAQCSSGSFGSVDVTVVGTAVVMNNNITTGSERIKALNTIESAKKIGDPNFTPAPVVTFEAGKSILLKPGFVADARSVFTAQIKGCN